MFNKQSIDMAFFYFLALKKNISINSEYSFLITGVKNGDGVLDICEMVGLLWRSGSKPTLFQPDCKEYVLTIDLHDVRLTYSSSLGSHEVPEDSFTADEFKRFFKEYEMLDEREKERLMFFANL